jgi:Restriction endonuclease
MELPKPKNWQDFERIVRDAQAQRWGSTDLQMHGRPGQTQDGVDIIGSDEIGRLVAIQCKRYKTALKLKDVADEVNKAEKIKDRLSALFIATTTDHDAELQGQVRELSSRRIASQNFAVGILYWDEIVSSLLLNPQVFKGHYPQIQLPNATSVDKERFIAALELGYYGTDLWDTIVLILGEFGQMAHEDPDNVSARLRTVEHRAQQVLPPDDSAVILESLANIRKLSALPKNSDNDWDPIEDLAKRISARIQTGSSLLPLPESNVLDLGIQLARIWHHSESIPTPAIRKDIEVKIRNIIKTPTTKSSIRTRLAKANTYKSGYSWANSVYSLLDHEIRYGGAS